MLPFLSSRPAILHEDDRKVLTRSVASLARHTPEVFFCVFVVTIVAGVLVVLSMLIPKNESIVVELSVDRAQFTVGASSSDSRDVEANSVHMSPVGFQDLSLEGFSEVRHDGESTLAASTLTAPIPRGRHSTSIVPSGNQQPGSFAIFAPTSHEKESARQYEPCSGSGDRKDRGERSGVLSSPQASLGRLASVVAKPGTTVVVMSADPAANSYAVSFAASEVSTSLSLAGPATFELQSSELRVDERAYSEGLYRAEWFSPRTATVLSKGGEFKVSFRLPCEKSVNFLHGGTAPHVSHIKFEKVTDAGVWVSAISSAKVSYPEHSHLKEISIQSPVGIFFDESAQFRLEKAETKPGTGQIDLRLSGKVVSFHTGTRDYDESHSVSFFEVLSEGKVVLAIFAALGWLLSLFSGLAAARWSGLAENPTEAGQCDGGGKGRGTA